MTSLSLIWAFVPGIRKGAAGTASGRPYCLVLPSRHRPVQSNFELTIPFATGNRIHPHMQLWVGDGGSMKTYIWSYWEQGFVERGTRHEMRSCQPRPNFLQTLARVESGMHIALPDGFHVIPAEFSPRHTDDDRFRMKFERDDMRPLRRAVIGLGSDKVSSWRKREDHDADLDRAKGARAERIEWSNGFMTRTFNEQGELIEQFRCINGSVCRIEYAENGALYDLTMDPVDIAATPQVKAKFRDLWESFRQDG